MEAFNLPQYTTPLVGREKELIELNALLAEPTVRLVTIVAPGGMGKTRLALACLKRQLTLRSPFADGVCFVKLAPLSKADEIPATLADALNLSVQGGTSPRQQLLNNLRYKKMLLLFDNFDQLLDGVDLVVDLLESAPGLKILVTSRERLHLRLEQLYPIEGLQIPDPALPENADRSTAIQLFLQTARHNQPDFALRGGDDLTHLTQICRVVAGMPLALELAASWVEMLPLAEIAAELQQGLDFLETQMRDLPKRHRSVRAAIEYSWRHLTQEEQEVFAKLSVFRAGFTRQAAKEVARANLRQLARLANKSLLQANRDDGRYQIHELLRQFGAEKLVESESVTGVQQRLCAYFTASLHQWESNLKSNGQAAAIRAIEADYGNIQAAWNYAMEEGRYDQLSLGVNALGEYFNATGRWTVGETLFGKTADAVMASHEDFAAIPAAARLVAWLSAWQASLSASLIDVSPKTSRRMTQQWLWPGLALLEQIQEQAQDYQTEEAFLRLQLGRLLRHVEIGSAEGEKQLVMSLNLYRAMDDEIGIADTYYESHFYAADKREYQEAQKRLAQNLDIVQRIGEPKRLVRALIASGVIAQALTEYGDAAALFEQAYRNAQQNSDLLGMEDARRFASHLARFLGEFELALSYLDEALELGRQANNWHRISFCLRFKGITLISLGRFEDAINLSHQDLAVRKLRETGWPLNLPRAYVHLGNYAAAELLLDRVGLVERLESKSWIALTKADYSEAKALAEQWFNQIHLLNYDHHFWARTPLAFALYKLGQTKKAQQELFLELEFCVQKRAFQNLMHLLPILALVLVDSDNEQLAERGVELFALAETWPFARNSRLLDEIVGQPIRSLSAGLSPSRVAAAQRRGQAQDWMETAKSLLTELAEVGWNQDPALQKERTGAEPGAQDREVQPRFIEEELVATGGFGKVYRGQDTGTGQQVTIKRLKADLVAEQPDTLARFVQEGELLRQLNHPNIVQMIAAQKINGRHCLIMEYVPGGTLRDLMDDRGQLPLVQTLDIALELADALTRAHHLSVIHRDLKPGNVLLAKDGTPRLTDFGLARMIQREGTPLTQGGAIMGTMEYMSPELFQGQELDGRADIWSFGVLLYEMLAGERPYKGDQIAATIGAILNKPFPDLLALRPDAPLALARLIEQMLVKDRRERIGRMRQVAAELDRIRDRLRSGNG